MDSRAGQGSGALALWRGLGSQDGAFDARTIAMSVPAGKRMGEGGFTLIETLVALALMGLVLSALASLTAQWLPNWNRGLDRIQRSEMIGIVMQRITDDLASAEYVSANRDEKG